MTEFSFWVNYAFKQKHYIIESIYIISAAGTPKQLYAAAIGSI